MELSVEEGHTYSVRKHIPFTNMFLSQTYSFHKHLPSLLVPITNTTPVQFLGSGAVYLFYSPAGPGRPAHGVESGGGGKLGHNIHLVKAQCVLIATVNHPGMSDEL